MIKNILRSMHTKFGKYIISVILGLGCASLFRRACNGRNCLLFRAPPLAEVAGTTYAHDGKCFRYEHRAANCRPNERDTVEFVS